MLEESFLNRQKKEDAISKIPIGTNESI